MTTSIRPEQPKSQLRQCLLSIGIVLAVSGLCSLIEAYVGYRVIAFILLLTVSALAVMFDILPVLIAASMSAFIWFFAFIPPRFSFKIRAEEDIILLLMYFVIAMINSVLMFRIRLIEKKARKKEERIEKLQVYETLLNSLSHELKTPIATIIAATDNLQTDQFSPKGSHHEELVSEISRAAMRLNQQVENLLNMSRLDSGFVKLKLDWYDVNELVYDAVKKIEEYKPAQRINIHIKPDLPLIRTDKMMIGQILYNLLNNARLHTPPGTLIDITVLLQADMLELTVEDNATGFPPEEIENVFDKFYRLKQTGAAGTGLGLSIVKGFVEVLHGHLSLTNRSGGGARFLIRIPVKTSTLSLPL
ncbi:MAG: sensor histidine kinase [Citrobacter freundii]|nr:MAG: sensor histidine kinase [Citrobacter freundii]